MAQRVHPDRKRNISEDANIAFHQIRTIYQFLGDPVQREEYERTGNGDSIAINSAIFGRLRHFFRRPTKTEEAELQKDYPGSSEERNDIANFIRVNDGNVTNLLDYVISGRPEKVDRYFKVFEHLFSAGDLDPKLRPMVRQTSPSLKRMSVYAVQRARSEAKAAREKEKALALARKRERIQEALLEDYSGTGVKLSRPNPFQSRPTLADIYRNKVDASGELREAGDNRRGVTAEPEQQSKRKKKTRFDDLDDLDDERPKKPKPKAHYKFQTNIR